MVRRFKVPRGLKNNFSADELYCWDPPDGSGVTRAALAGPAKIATTKRKERSQPTLVARDSIVIGTTEFSSDIIVL